MLLFSDVYKRQYPIEAHWIWGGGWLANLGFHDYAGSCAIHMVGGICALIGAAFLGPRIGKFKKDKMCIRDSFVSVAYRERKCGIWYEISRSIERKTSGKIGLLFENGTPSRVRGLSSP